MRATQRLKAVPPFILAKPFYFPPCGTMLFFLFAGDVAHRGASNLTCKMMRVDQVDYCPPDLDQTHIFNARRSISLMKSDGCDHSKHLAIRRGTRGLHKDNPMRIGQHTSRGVKSALWDCGPPISRGRNRPNSHQQIIRTAIFAIKSLKIDALSVCK